jgi:hypothetical protein
MEVKPASLLKIKNNFKPTLRGEAKAEKPEGPKDKEKPKEDTETDLLKMKPDKNQRVEKIPRVVADD